MMMDTYIPLKMNDKACLSLSKTLKKHGISVERQIDESGVVMITLANKRTGKSHAFPAPLNLWLDTPIATVALAAQLAFRRRESTGSFERWLKWAGYGPNKDYMRIREMRRAEMEEDDAWRLVDVFVEALGPDWRTPIVEALG